MGRKKQFNRDEALEFIVHEIWKNGFSNCSVKALSEKLGITRSSFYNAFGSQEELFLEALAFYANSTPDQALNGLSGENKKISNSIVDMFQQVCRTVANDNEAKGCLAVNALTQLHENDGVLGQILFESVRGKITLIERLLKYAAKNGEIPKTQLKTKAQSLQTLLVGINVMSKVIRDEKSLWQMTKHSLDGLGITRQ